MSETVGLTMKEDKVSQKTVILNNYESDGFLDFDYFSDLDEVMKELRKIIIK